MKLLFFGDDFRLGALNSQSQVVDVSDAVKDIPHQDPQGLIRGVIEQFATYRGRLEEAASRGQGQPVDQVRVRPPLPHPTNIICMAVNYMEDGTRSEPAPINAFMKSPSAIIGPGDTMLLPDVAATSGRTIVSPWPMIAVGDFMNALMGAGSERVPSSM